MLYSIVENDEKLPLTVLLYRRYFLPVECSCELYAREEENCDYLIPVLGLFKLKQEKKRKQFDLEAQTQGAE